MVKNITSDNFRHRLYCYKCGVQGHDGDFEWSNEYKAYVCEKHIYQPAYIRDQYEVDLDDSDMLAFTTVQARVGIMPSERWGFEPGVRWGEEDGERW